MTVRRVITGTDFGWDGGVAHLPAGTIMQVEPGSVLESYIGAANLETLDAGAAPAAAATAGASN
jgi:hypothetical protein